jgi:hypothetical protein
MLSKINESYDMLVPGMPVCDTSEYFDKDFYNKNYEKIRMAYDALSDGFSRSLFASIVWFKLTGKMDYIMNFTSEKSEIYSLLLPAKCLKIIDLGGYNGDTLREAKEYFELELKAYPYSALYAGFEHAMLNLARDSQYDIAMSRARLERNLALRGLSLKSENLGQLDHDFDDRPLNWSKLK